MKFKMNDDDDDDPGDSGGGGDSTFQLLHLKSFSIPDVPYYA